MKMKLLCAAAAAVVLGAGCVVYTQADGVGSITGVTLSGAQVNFTIYTNQSQGLSDIYFGTCGAGFGCYQLITAGNTTDATGNEALNDCNPNNDGVCGTDEINALWGRLYTQPGGFPYSTQWETDCLGFGVTAPVSAIWDNQSAYFNYGTWYWVRPGSWGCNG